MTEIALQLQAGRQAPPIKAGNGTSKTVGGTGRSPEGEGERLAEACSEFEAIFVEQLFKTMRASVPDVGLLRGGRAEAIYSGMLDQQIAMEMARGQGSIGLASQLRLRLAPDRMPRP